MSSRSVNASSSALDKWLATLGFSRGNPFARTDANLERDLLPAYFVEVADYERIKGEPTVLVIAPPGGGKTAIRVELASQVAPCVADATMLGVECIELGSLIDRSPDADQVTLRECVGWLLQAGLRALLDALCGPVPDGTVAGDTTRNWQRRRARASRLTPLTRVRLAHFLGEHHRSLLSMKDLYGRLHAMNPSFEPSLATFQRATEQHALRELVEADSLCQDASALLLADLSDYAAIPTDTTTSVADLDVFRQLAKEAGYSQVQFLIDDLDVQGSGKTEVQAQLVEALLVSAPASMHLGFEYKLFLTPAICDRLEKLMAEHRERLAPAAVCVRWTDKQLKRLLQERLVAYSDGRVSDLAQLCEPMPTQAADGQVIHLARWLEGQLVQVARGSPRRLLLASQSLCQAHVDSSGGRGLLSQADWKAARSSLLALMPVVLYLSEDISRAWVGDKAIKLTLQERRILQALVAHEGWCDRLTLVDEAWGAKGGVSDETIDQAIKRLRRKLGDTAEDPIFLHTERGRGFSLLNYEVQPGSGVGREKTHGKHSGRGGV